MCLKDEQLRSHVIIVIQSVRRLDKPHERLVVDREPGGAGERHLGYRACGAITESLSRNQDDVRGTKSVARPGISPGHLPEISGSIRRSRGVTLIHVWGRD